VQFESPDARPEVLLTRGPFHDAFRLLLSTQAVNPGNRESRGLRRLVADHHDPLDLGQVVDTCGYANEPHLPHQSEGRAGSDEGNVERTPDPPTKRCKSVRAFPISG
jgi:hypothetical protein